MSNENKDRKLKHHEKPIWRKAFEASMQHTSIEGATRNAWKAVDVWIHAGVFNESSENFIESKVDGPVSLSAMREAWQILTDFIDGDPGAKHISKAMRRYGEGLISPNDFRNQLSEIDLPEHVIDWEGAWSHLGETLQGCAKSSNDWEDRLAKAMLDYSKSEMTLSEFKEEVDLIFRDFSE